MLRRLTRVLIALLVALAATMPIGARAMPMPMPPAAGGVDAGQPCQNCPQPHQPGSMDPGKMPACQVLACTGALATLPVPALMHERVQFKVAYGQPTPARWDGAAPAPDPFPPRPVALR